MSAGNRVEEPRRESAAVVLDMEAGENVVVDVRPATVTRTTMVAPDGGFGWIVVFGCFLISFFHASYGKGFIPSFPQEFSAGGAVYMAVIKSLPTCLPAFLAPWVRVFWDRFGYRSTFGAGVFLCSLATILGYAASSAGLLTCVLSIILSTGLAGANFARLECMKKHFTPKRRHYALTLNAVGGIAGGVAAKFWVPSLVSAVGFGYTWLVWCVILVVVSGIGLLVFGRPENHFVAVVEEVPVTDATAVAVDVVQSVEEPQVPPFFKRMVKLLGFSYLRNPQFVMMVVICIALSCGTSISTGSVSKVAKSLGFEADRVAILAWVVTCGELVAAIGYGLMSPRKLFPRYAELTAALLVSALCAGIPYLYGAFPMLVVVAFLGGLASGMLKSLPILVLIENHGVANLVETSNLYKMVEGLAKFSVAVGSAQVGGWFQYFSVGAVLVAAVIGVAHCLLCIRLRRK